MSCYVCYALLWCINWIDSYKSVSKDFSQNQTDCVVNGFLNLGSP